MHSMISHLSGFLFESEFEPSTEAVSSGCWTTPACSSSSFCSPSATTYAPRTRLLTEALGFSLNSVAREKNQLSSFFNVSKMALLHLFVALMGASLFCVSDAVQRSSSSNTSLAASFVFGDSLVDAGNNNYIVTLSKANIPPNGCDFKPTGGRPNGRYTNGRIIPDIIADELGHIPYSPPYLAPTANGSAILHGVNFASGGSGILNSTGSIFVGRLSMEVQVNNYADTRKQLIKMLGSNGAKELLSKSIFSVTMGSNDFINNYLTPFLSTAQRAVVSSDVFIQQVISAFKIQLKRMYELDARKIVVANVGPLGCIPYERTLNRVGEDQCAAAPNNLAQKFNKRLKILIDQLNKECPKATFVYANTYDMVEDLIKNYAKYGFEASNVACCGRGGQFRGIIPCGPTSVECADHTKYVFWDPYHPSEAANVIVAKRLIDGGPNDISPVNVRTLIQQHHSP